MRNDLWSRFTHYVLRFDNSLDVQLLLRLC